MRLTRCFSSLGCPEFGLDEMFALAAKHQLDAVELRALHGSVDLPRQLESEFGSPQTLAQKLSAGRSLPIAALNTSFRLIGAEPEARQAFLDFVPWAEALRIPRLRVFDGGRRGAADGWAEAAEMARWWAALRAERGWQTDIMVETHDAFVTTAALQRFTGAAPETAILWDSHHTWRHGGEDPVATWRAVRRRVCHVHVKDSIAVPSGRLPFTYVLPGRGEFPMAKLLHALREDGFTGVVSLEWEKMWHPELGTLEEALTAAGQNSWW